MKVGMGVCKSGDGCVEEVGVDYGERSTSYWATFIMSM